MGPDRLHRVQHGAREESTQEMQLWREREGIKCYYASICVKKATQCIALNKAGTQSAFMAWAELMNEDAKARQGLKSWYRYSHGPWPHFVLDLWLRSGGEGDDRGWEGWMASPTQWMWVWANSRRWWRTGKPGVLQSMGSQKVGHDLVTEQQQQHSWKKKKNLKEVK